MNLYNKIPDINYRVLIPNVLGYNRLRNYNFDEFSIVISSSKTHNMKNVNNTIDQSIKHYKKVAHLANADRKPFRAYISCAYGCPYEGYIENQTVCDISKCMLDIGAYEVSISDTIGVGTPLTTQCLIESLLQDIPRKNIALHMHNTKNMALSNIYESMKLGIQTFDSSFGGIGGCPYAQGASGNIATEDIVSMMYHLNIKTSINLDKLCKTSLYAQRILKKKLPSQTLSLYNI
jgi:hydroxymethylglutaryl-CoA lyase